MCVHLGQKGSTTDLGGRERGRWKRRKAGGGGVAGREREGEVGEEGGWVAALVCVLENDKVNNIFVRTIRVSSKKWGRGLINIFGFWCWPENLR